MTEQEWMGCIDPSPMLAFLQGRASDRKLRLFAVACGDWREVWLTDRRYRDVVRVTERFADGNATEDDLASARAHAKSFDRGGIDDIVVEGLTAPNAWDAAQQATEWQYFKGLELDEVVKENRRQADVLRDIFGNPFRSMAFDPAWRTPAAVAVAEAIYNERRFADLPILADALEEAGCTNRDILEHCRGGGDHVRGCWPLDLVLNRD